MKLWKDEGFHESAPLWYIVTALKKYSPSLFCKIVLELQQTDDWSVLLTVEVEVEVVVVVVGGRPCVVWEVNTDTVRSRDTQQGERDN